MSTGLSPSELLNGRQIRTKIDTLLPCPSQVAQNNQAKQNDRMNQDISKVKSNRDINKFKVGTACYATCYNSQNRKQVRWVPATVVKVHGTRSVNVKVHPRGPIWKRHINQLRLRYGADQDDDPGENISLNVGSSSLAPSNSRARPEMSGQQLASSPRFGLNNPRRSQRTRRAPCRLNL